MPKHQARSCNKRFVVELQKAGQHAGMHQGKIVEQKSKVANKNEWMESTHVM